MVEAEVCELQRHQSAAQREAPSFWGSALSAAHPTLACVAGHMPCPLPLSSPGAWGYLAALLHALTLDRLPPWVCPEGKRLLIGEDFSCIYSHDHGFLKKKWWLLWECKLIQPWWRWYGDSFKKTRRKTTIRSSNPTTGHVLWENHNTKKQQPKTKKKHVPYCSMQHDLQ